MGREQSVLGTEKEKKDERVSTERKGKKGEGQSGNGTSKKICNLLHTLPSPLTLARSLNSF